MPRHNPPTNPLVPSSKRRRTVSRKNLFKFYPVFSFAIPSRRYRAYFFSQHLCVCVRVKLMIAKSSYTHRFMFFPSLCCSSFLCHLTQDYPIKSIMMLLLSSAIQSNLARPSPPAILWLRNLYRYSTYFIVITHCSSPVLCSQSYPRFVSLFELPMFNISRSLKPTRNHPKPSQAGMCILMGSSYID